MHTYLKSIGFSEYKYNCDINKLVNEVHENPDNIEASTLLDDTYVTMEKDFAPGVGIGIFGAYDKADRFEIEYYYPYCHFDQVSTTSPLRINRRIDRYAFAAMGEDYRLGFSLIFYLQNVNGYLDLVEANRKMDAPMEVSLCGLSNKGMILLPLAKSEKAKEKASIALKERKTLIQSALGGDETAIEKLTMQDMNSFQQANQRARKEDLYTIIESFFMPAGMECDIYSIMGEITAMEEVTNSLSKEKLWKLSLNCNNIDMGLLINAKDLIGEPAVGRRFKGEVWLQGQVKFPEI